MPCKGGEGDYLCDGWRRRAEAIRKRDGGRCRGCGRGEAEVRLEVHHRAYGRPGPCGQCHLLGVADEDLTTLCADCHEAVTNVRRGVRFARRIIVAAPVPPPAARAAPMLQRTVLVASPEPTPALRTAPAVRRAKL